MLKPALPVLHKLLPFELILPQLALLEVEELEIVEGEIEILLLSLVVVESGRSIIRFLK